MKALFNVEVPVEVVSELSKTILAILACPVGDEVKQTALRVLSKAVKVENISLSNCNFTGAPEEDK